MNTVSADSPRFYTVSALNFPNFQNSNFQNALSLALFNVQKWFTYQNLQDLTQILMILKLGCLMANFVDLQATLDPSTSLA